jgi:predicted kinase
MDPTTVILITGHPATGKTTLAHYLAQALHMPLLYRDGLKETLADTLGWSTEEWSLKLGAATWELLYHLVETLLRADVSHIVESNFTSVRATGRWQQLCERYSIRIIQLRCEADPALVIERFHTRVAKGERHPIHRYSTDTTDYRKILEQGPPDWIDVPGERITVDTGQLEPAAYQTIVVQLQHLLYQRLS